MLSIPNARLNFADGLGFRWTSDLSFDALRCRPLRCVRILNGMTLSTPRSRTAFPLLREVS